MSTHISPQAAAAREAARHATGEFGVQAHTAPDPGTGAGWESRFDADVVESARAAADAVLWSTDVDMDGDPVGDGELDGESMEFLATEIADFKAAHPELVERLHETGYGEGVGFGFDAQFGHDFALTATGSGGGFNDRPTVPPLLAQELSEAVRRRPMLEFAGVFRPDPYGDRSVLSLDGMGYHRGVQGQAEAVFGAVFDGVGDSGPVRVEPGWRVSDLSYSSQRRLLDAAAEADGDAAGGFDA